MGIGKPPEAEDLKSLLNMQLISYFIASSKGLLTFEVFHIGDLFQKQQRIAKAQLGFTCSRFVAESLVSNSIFYDFL